SCPGGGLPTHGTISPFHVRALSRHLRRPSRSRSNTAAAARNTAAPPPPGAPGVCWQPPPSVPFATSGGGLHLYAASQTKPGAQSWWRSIPAGSVVHTPRDETSAHEWHAPVHAESQQTPCTQWP